MAVEKLGGAYDAGETMEIAANDGGGTSLLLGEVPGEIRKKWLGLLLPVVEMVVNRSETRHS